LPSFTAKRSSSHHSPARKTLRVLLHISLACPCRFAMGQTKGETMRKYLIMLFIIGLVLGCGTARKNYEAGLQSLEGKHADNFFKSWGPPSAKVDLSDGGYILSWSKSQMKNSGTYNTTSTKAVMLPSGSLVSVPVSQTHGGGSYTRIYEVIVEFSKDNLAQTLTYNGGPACRRWFPVPDTK